MKKEEFNPDEWQGRTWDKVIGDEKLGFYSALVFISTILILAIWYFINK